MPMIKTGEFRPVKTIVGKDLDIGATFNAIIAVHQGLIPAGRFMTYRPTTKDMVPYTGVYTGAPAATDAELISGILAQDVDSGGTGDPEEPGMIYRRGTFLLQEIEEANSATIRDQAFLQVLRKNGLYFEWSWEGYALMEPGIPGGPIP